MATSAETLAQLQAAQGARKSLESLGSQSESQFGVNAAREQVGGLRGAIANTTNLLKQVAPSVMGRTGGSLVTAAQASRQIQNEQAPISETLTQQSQDYNLANADLADILTRAQQQAQAQYADQESKLSYLQNLYNTIYQREQDEARRRAEEAARQEQIRQFNEQLALSRKAASGSGGFNLGGGAAGISGGGDPSRQQAQSEVANMLQRRGTIGFLNELVAINKSASYGNTLDRIKLELLRASQPGYFKSDGSLDTQRISKLRGIY